MSTFWLTLGMFAAAMAALAIGPARGRGEHRRCGGSRECGGCGRGEGGDCRGNGAAGPGREK